jgi:hypothetical protein
VLSAPTRLLRDRRVLVGAVVVVLVGALLVSIGHWGRSDDQAAEPVAQAAASGCADALLVGVNGNGESTLDHRAFGRTVQAVVGRVRAKAER